MKSCNGLLTPTLKIDSATRSVGATQYQMEIVDIDECTETDITVNCSYISTEASLANYFQGCPVTDVTATPAVSWKQMNLI